MNKLSRFTVMSLVLVLVLSLATGAITAQDKKVIYTSFGPGDVPGLDPSYATDTSSVQIISEIFPGLTRLHEETIALEPGMATWEVSEDGLTYTFNILPDISWVQYDPDSDAVVQVMDDDGNVRTVTAGDFVYGWQRSIETGEYYPGVLAKWVVNGSTLYNGELGDSSQLGVTAIDDLTLEVTATQAAAFLPNVFGMWMASAQPAWLIEEQGDFWTEPENIQSYGPFALKEWNHDEDITIIKNPFWAGTDTIPAPKVDEVNWTMIDASAQLANFEAGLLDVSQVPSADMDRLRNTPEFFIGPVGCSYYYGFNVTKEPVNDARVRRALSMAIDRQGLIDNILKGGQQPAGFFSRPDLVGAPDQNDYPDQAIFSDVEGAQAELQSYLDEMGIGVDEMAPIILMHNESEAHRLIAQAAQQMWSETLGVNVEIQSQEWAVYLDTLDGPDTSHIYRLGWCLDYPDAHNFLFDVFHSSNEPSNKMAEPTFDALVEEAMVEADEDARRDIYAQAEGFLVNEFAGIAPIYYYTTVGLTSSRIERTYSQIGSQRYEKWDVVQ